MLTAAAGVLGVVLGAVGVAIALYWAWGKFIGSVIRGLFGIGEKR
jgi:hypothetical protein